MNWLKEAFRRWKAKHWDNEYFPEDRGGITPQRKLWEDWRWLVIAAARGAALLAVGALFLRVIGLG